MSFFRVSGDLENLRFSSCNLLEILLNFAKKCLCTGLESRLDSSLLVSRQIERDRLVSRLVTCRLDLVSSRDFRLVTGSMKSSPGGGF